METTDVDKMKKLSTIRNQKMPKNRVIHEVMNIIHIIWDKLFVDDMGHRPPHHSAVWSQPPKKSAAVGHQGQRPRNKKYPSKYSHHLSVLYPSLTYRKRKSPDTLMHQD